MHLRWSRSQARLFQLYAVGLHARSYPKGRPGIRRCFADLDALQLDTLPILGRSHDLVIQARVDGTHPDQALDLIHQERLGFEYWDKALCAVPVRHFPASRAFMQAEGSQWESHRAKHLAKHFPGAIEEVYQALQARGPLSSQELKGSKIAQGEHRAWKSTTAANSALEVLWNRGHISVSHRVSFRRYFDLTERVLPPDQVETAPHTWEEFQTYWLKKRVQNAGLLSLSGDSESWALVRDMRRGKSIETLVERDELAQVEVKGIKSPFLAPANAAASLARAEQAALSKKARFLSPLDPLVWGRNTLQKLWDFQYVWEVYKPLEQRRWGYYVLPVLCQDRFVARFDGKYDRREGALHVLSYHPESDGFSVNHPAISSAFERFLGYLGGERIVYPKTRKGRRSALTPGGSGRPR